MGCSGEEHQCSPFPEATYKLWQWQTGGTDLQIQISPPLASRLHPLLQEVKERESQRYGLLGCSKPTPPDQITIQSLYEG